MTRDERQDLAISLYRKSNGRGTFNHCTGFGKTTEAKKIVNKIKEVHGDIDYIVCVPTSPLKDQWEDRLDKDNHKVITIQWLLYQIKHGIIPKDTKIKCHFLVIDEIHKFAADQFSLIFEYIEYKFILGLTATYERLDGKQEIIDRFCPVIDIVTLEEARRNGWVADFTEYNWGIELSEEERKEYNELNERIDKHFPFFNTDYQLMISCCSAYGANNFIRIYDPEVIIEGKQLVDKSLVEYVTSKANVGKELFDRRSKILNDSPTKIDAVIEAVHYLKMKTVTFGLTINTADVITDKLKPIAVSYHSSIPTEVMMLPNKKGIIKPKKVGGKTRQKMVLDDFDKDKYQVMNTAKKADLGLDVAGLRAAIVYAATEDSGVHDQRRGRITRKEEITVDGQVVWKEAIIVNIYFKNTKDEYKLKHRQKNSFRIRNISRIDQIEI